MDKVIEAAKELRNTLENDELVKEYHRVEKLYKESEELKKLKDEIILLEKDVNSDKKQLSQLLEEYNNHPLTINYQTLKTEVADYLKEIANIINN